MSTENPSPSKRRGKPCSTCGRPKNEHTPLRELKRGEHPCGLVAIVDETALNENGERVVVRRGLASSLQSTAERPVRWVRPERLKPGGDLRL